ncbi:hypothetical protein [Prevotella denticola]|uniref:hypothetical protein n=1 Tax=Prevotella denticola TaxID=28129 RepID=UPI003C738CD5
MDAIRQVGTFPPGKCCRGRDRNNMCQENSSMGILETQERKMNKNKEKKKGLTHFLGHYQQQTHQYLYSPHHIKKEGCNDA